jgi:hypothetical protein
MNNNEILYTGLGKRKTSVAKVFLQNGSGVIQVNNKPFETFFLGIGEERELIKNPLILVNLNNVYDIDIQVSGGGKSASLNAQTSAKYCCAANGCDIRFAPGFSSWYEAPNCGKPSGCNPTLQWHMISFENTPIGTCNGCGMSGSGSIGLDISFGGSAIFVPNFGSGTTVYVSYYPVYPVV